MNTIDPPGPIRGGLFLSLRRLAATVVAMAHTRVELFGTELEEELNRAVEMMIGAMVCLAFAGLAMLFGALAIVATFWDTHRIAAVACVALGFLMLAAASAVVVRIRRRRGTPVLAATLGELERDWNALSGDGR